MLMEYFSNGSVNNMNRVGNIWQVVSLLNIFGQATIKI